MTLAVDMSSWGGPITSAKVESLWQAGARRAIVGVSDVELARQQLTLTAERGMEIQAYSYMYWGANNEERLDRVRRAAQGLPLAFVWPDFEDKNAPLDDPAGVISWMRGCMALAERLGLPVGVYTAAWWWRSWARNTAAFAHYPLWVAQYDEWPVLTMTPFGGWTECAMKQYKGTTVLGSKPNDYSVDLNFYLGGGPMPEEVVDEKARRAAAQDAFRQHIAGLFLSGDPALADRVYWELQYVRLCAGLPIVQPPQ